MYLGPKLLLPQGQKTTFEMSVLSLAMLVITSVIIFIQKFSFFINKISQGRKYVLEKSTFSLTFAFRNRVSYFRVQTTEFKAHFVEIELEYN